MVPLCCTAAQRPGQNCEVPTDAKALRTEGWEAKVNPTAEKGWPAVRCEAYAVYGSALTHETLCAFYISLPCVKAENYEIPV